MSMITLYHNPRCSKSRQVLALLQSSKLAFEVVEYLKQPLNAKEIEMLLTKLNCSAAELIRKKEAKFKEMALGQASETGLMKAMSEVPKLMERPIVVCDDKAVIGRPTENVVAFIEALQ